MTTPDPAQTNGPNADGSGVINRESKFGQAVTVAVSGVLLALADVVKTLDVTPLPDWMEQTAVVGLGAVAGLLVARATKNRRVPASGVTSRY